MNSKQFQVLQELGVENDYPYVSPCGVELNFVRSADLPLVFHSLQQNGKEKRQLVFGGTLTQPFSPDKLAISVVTGRLYHELINGTDAKGKSTLTPLHRSSEKVEYGLVRSSVAVSLSDSIIVSDAQNETDVFSGMEFHCNTLNESFPIKWLPIDAQPGPWAMPFVEGMK